MKQPRIASVNLGTVCLCALLVFLGCGDQDEVSTCCNDGEPNGLSLSVAKYPDNKKAGLSITFDDGCSSVFDKIIPMMNAYNLKGTFYIIAGHVELRNEWAKWKAVREDGHDIGNHSLTHEYYLGSISDYKILRQEIDSSFRLIRDRLGKGPFSFGHPFHSAGPKADKIVFENHFTTKISPAGFSKLVSLYDLSVCKAEMKVALRKGEWVVTTAHGVDDKFCYNSLTSDFFTKFLDYVTSHTDSIHVDTFENLSKYKIEASDSHLSVERLDDRRFIVKLRNELPTSVFDYPLTIVVRGLSNASERIQPYQHKIEVTPVQDGANVKIPPNGSFIILAE